MSWYASYTRVAFFNDFTTRVNSYIGTTIVVPDCVAPILSMIIQHGNICHMSMTMTSTQANAILHSRSGDVIHPQL